MKTRDASLATKLFATSLNSCSLGFAWRCTVIAHLRACCKLGIPNFLIRRIPRNFRMAAFAQAEPRGKRPCTTAGVTNLRERYTEDTADVFFVGGETKERLPAHREVLKVASPVFFRMFSGNWKEEREKKIPAPEEYKWGSFKAAIALLYGEEVEVEESSIPDVYRVAHCYNLTGVISTLAQEVCQWGSHLLHTVVKVCALSEGVPEGENNLLNVAVEYIARHVEELSPSDLTCFSYEVM